MAIVNETASEYVGYSTTHSVGSLGGPCSVSGLPEVMVVSDTMILSIRSQNYVLPQFTQRMKQVKALNVTGYGVYPAHLHSLSWIGTLSNLRAIRFEHVSFHSSFQPIFERLNLQKLCFVMCEFGDAFLNDIAHSHMLPDLTDLEFDRCYDLKELPQGLGSIIGLRKLSITNCHELNALPKGLGNLSNLESLSLDCCTKLQELPESIGSLHHLRFLDISDCLSINALPEEIGELCSLRVLKMTGCRGLEELPMSMDRLSQLEEVTCDEETSYLWMNLESDLCNPKVKVVEEDRFQSFMKIIQ